MTSKKFGAQSATLTYNGTDWSTSVSFYFLENETPTVSAIYAPCYEVTEGGVMQLKEGMHPGMTEYIPADCSFANAAISINFTDVTRTYSRLRMAGQVNQTLTVITTGFTPAGGAEDVEQTYTLTTDDKGNAFLYGTFAANATVSVKQGDVVLNDYTFTAEAYSNGTEHNKSYALDARPVIDGTLGGKDEATEDDITALVEQLKSYVDNGITTIIVPGSEPALIEMDSWTNTAIGEAIYRLSEDESYNGKIDLILPDVTEIVDQEFYYALALNSITLPKVTTIGDGAFQSCLYMKQITFGSVVTSIVQKNNVTFVVGDKVDGCDLVLNCGQLQTEDTYKPDLENNVWFKPSWGGDVTWNSITLTHTGENSECDECKAL